MPESAVRPARSAGRGQVLAGLVGSALAAVGDVLILGRPSSGAEFDRGAGVVPANGEVVERWRSLWNGAIHSRGRVHAGTVVGVVGIGLLTGTGLRGVAQAIDPGPLRQVAVASVAGFAASGVATHVCCGAVILAYRRARGTASEGAVTRAPAAATGLLAVSAVGTLGSLAALSGAHTFSGLFRRGGEPTVPEILTPFACVLATLLTFGRLPAPVGGYARPASISLGLLAYFSVTAIVTQRARRPWAS
jgi:hypothetical protein